MLFFATPVVSVLLILLNTSQRLFRVLFLELLLNDCYCCCLSCVCLFFTLKPFLCCHSCCCCLESFCMISACSCHLHSHKVSTHCPLFDENSSSLNQRQFIRLVKVCMDHTPPAVNKRKTTSLFFKTYLWIYFMCSTALLIFPCVCIMCWAGVHDGYSHQGSIFHFLSKLSYLMHRINQKNSQKSSQMLLTSQQGLKWCLCTLRYKCMWCTMK